jgi:heme-degrading monooxygenase HmoA
MFARLTIAPALPGKSEEVISLHRDSVVPACRQQQGFKGLYLLHDRKSGKGYTISLWETEADMTTAETTGFYVRQVAKFRDVLSGPTVRETYEVQFFP